MRLLLFDIGNTHTHLGLATPRRVLRCGVMPTRLWFEGGAECAVRRWMGSQALGGGALCSVVPRATPHARALARRLGAVPWLELASDTVRGVGLNYPRPSTIGPDRLANAVAARARFGAPVIVIDFGTAVTFDVVDRQGNYSGGIIAPGLAAMTDYLHEKTALLPRIRIIDVRTFLGRSTQQAMRIGAVHGYRALIRGLLRGLRSELGLTRASVVATGGYARLIAARLPEITAVVPGLTLDGLRLDWLNHAAGSGARRRPVRRRGGVPGPRPPPNP